MKRGAASSQQHVPPTCLVLILGGGRTAGVSSSNSSGSISSIEARVVIRDDMRRVGGSGKEGVRTALGRCSDGRFLGGSSGESKAQGPTPSLPSQLKSLKGVCMIRSGLSRATCRNPSLFES
jgi:hypothetical protein